MAYIGNPPISGNFQVCDAISVVNGQAAYTMQVDSVNVSPETANHMLVSLNGILQKPNSSFTISGSTITFASNLATGDVIDFILLLGNVNDIGTPSDATVTNAKTNFVSTSSAAGLQIKGDGTTDGTLQLNCSQNSHGVKLKSPAHSAGQSYTLTLPATAPATDKMIQTNSSGVLSFVDAPSGGFKLISRQAVAAATYAEFNQVMTTDHYQYIFFLEGVQPANNGVNLLLEFQTSDESSGAYDTGSNYNHTAMRNNDGNSVAQTGQTALQLSRDGAGDNDSNRLYSGQINVANASSTTDHKMVYHFGGGRQHDGTFSGQLMFGTYEDTSRLTGARFKFSAGNFAAKGFISLYGLITS